MATHSSILTWEVPQTEEPGRLQPTGSEKSRTQHSNRDLSSEIPEAAEITTHMNENYRKAEDKEGKEEEREGGREYEGVACTTKPPAS